MSVHIQNIECRVPETSYSQTFIREKMKDWLKASRKTERYINCIYKNSGINKRHSIITDMDAFFKAIEGGTVTTPTTKVRNDLFTQAAKQMYVDLARKVLEDCDNTDFEDITHVITVSCTGFYNPGPDHDIIDILGLKRGVQRYNIGFMGCYGAFPAFRLADSVCKSNPQAAVLIVAVELCTLHAQLKNNLDSILANSIFADGGAAAIVSTKTPGPEQPIFEIEHFESDLIPNSRDDMAWTIGDRGFEMVLSQNVPEKIERNISKILIPMLRGQGLAVSDIDHWAVHPGGKSILDKIESSLNISGSLQVSRSILKKYGNMSSATILFVLKEVLREPCKNRNELVLLAAFGPGLTVEVGLLTKKPAASFINSEKLSLI